MKLLIMLTAAATLSASAASACVQSDLAGTWTLYTFGETVSGEEWNIRCSFSIDVYGKTGSATCRRYTYNPLYSYAFNTVGGRLMLSNATRCAFKGKFNLGSGDVIVSDVSLSLDKEVGNGLMGDSRGFRYLLSMVRY